MTRPNPMYKHCGIMSRGNGGGPRKARPLFSAHLRADQLPVLNVKLVRKLPCAFVVIAGFLPVLIGLPLL